MFTLFFFTYVSFRSYNADIGGTEQPMDFMYLNAAIESPTYPPIDPWLAGERASYYYFGYVIVGAPVKLLGIAPSVAYNLIIPALFAMTGIGVFSIAYNWVQARSVGAGQSASPPKSPSPAEPERETSPLDGGTSVGAYSNTLLRGGAEQNAAPTEARPPKGNAWLAGLLALVLAIGLVVDDAIAWFVAPAAGELRARVAEPFAVPGDPLQMAGVGVVVCWRRV